MAEELKTVGEEPANVTSLDDGSVDPLLREQKAQADQMRAALLSCRKSDISSAKIALQNIAVLQVYHQVARIIRFVEVMDRLEDKMYASIDSNLSQMDECDPATMMMLIKAQSELQKTMVSSWDLLKPYMDIDITAIAPPKEVDDTSSFGAAILPKESRTAIRNGAQALLTELNRKSGAVPNDAQLPEQPSDDNSTEENRSEGEEVNGRTDTTNSK